MELSKDDIIKAEIIVHARDLFARYGFEKVTMNEIAKVGKRAKSTVYHYFESKDEIIEATLDLEATEIYAQFLSEIKPGMTACDKLKLYVKTFISEADKKVNLSNVVRNDFSSRLGSPTILKRLHTEKEHVKKILLEGIETGEFASTPQLDLAFISEVFVSSMFGVLIYFVLNEKVDNLNAKMDVFADVFFSGFMKMNVL